MKRTIKVLSLILMVSAVTVSYMHAQTEIKFAHLNNEQLIRSLPETDSAMTQLENFRQQLIKDIEALQVEFNNAYSRFTEESGNWSEMVRRAKEEELSTMNQNIENFQMSAQQEMQTRQNQLMAPIMEKVDKAIKDVGREHGFIYVFNVGQGGDVLYFDEAKSTDIMDLVKAKLGIQ